MIRRRELFGVAAASLAAAKVAQGELAQAAHGLRQIDAVQRALLLQPRLMVLVNQLAGGGRGVDGRAVPG